MEKQPIYTIGHGNRTKDQFLNLLVSFGISYVVDVRSIPYSKINPAFNRSDVEGLLKSKEIKYVFLGGNLGGRPSDITCYDESGRVDYLVVQEKEFFQEGIQRLKIAYEKNLKVALMCSEMRPSDCHRSKLIGRYLSAHGVDIVHIDERGRLKSQITVINELNKGLSDNDLFDGSQTTMSRKPYL